MISILINCETHDYSEVGAFYWKKLRLSCSPLNLPILWELIEGHIVYGAAAIRFFLVVTLNKTFFINNINTLTFW